uniref:TGF-beta family profile domain-containing protein n=1 Tax=Setaria digitata TaxID=48799 RepID=A0A915PL25_9BILA
MFSVFRLFGEIAFIANVMAENDTTILTIAPNSLSSWEYEDFIVQHYKQRLIKPMKDFKLFDGDLDSKLKNVIIKTNDDNNGLIKYRTLIIGVKATAHENFDLSKKMLEWMMNKTEEAVIQLQCIDQCPESVQPILFTELEIRKDFRQKRGIRRDEDCSNRKCCLKTRYFQFRNSGYEHIAAPDGFLMNFCEGICDQTLIPATNDRNALIQAIKISNLRFNPFKNKWVCCVPTKFTSVNITERYSKGKQRSFHLKNVKVVECGCVI